MTNKITKFIGEHEFLSNFYPSEIIFDGQKYPTVEHAFQAAKTLDPKIRIKIRNAKTPGLAKKMGRSVKLREDWEKIKYSMMSALVSSKFLTHPELKQKLIDTGDAELIESNYWRDTTWGVYMGVGTNWLGKILMDVRNICKDDDYLGLGELLTKAKEE